MGVAEINNDINFLFLNRLGNSYIYKFNAQQTYDEIKCYINNVLINTITNTSGEFSVNVEKANLLLYGDDFRFDAKVGPISYSFAYKIIDYFTSAFITGEEPLKKNGIKKVEFYEDTLFDMQIFMYVTGVDFRGVNTAIPEVFNDPSFNGVQDIIPFVAPPPIYQYEKGFNDGFIIGRYTR